MSNVRTLYTNLAAVDLTFTKEAGGTIKPTAYDLDDLPKAIESAHLPCRLLLPTEEWGAEGTQLVPLSAGGTGVFGEMVWNVTDLLLWEAVGQGRGLMDHLPNLVRYAGAYTEAVMDHRVGATNVRLASLMLRPGVFEYPLGSGRQFFGVEALSSWRELINP